jgi:hypothetical protein
MMSIKTIFPISLSAVSLSAIALTTAISTVRAVPPQQSDSTGTNTWNSTTPIFEIESQLDPETLAKARELSQGLNDAYSACVGSVESAANLPRRFSRNPENRDRVCISSECATYNRLLEETRTFLSQIDIPEEERLRAIQNLRTW